MKDHRVFRLDLFGVGAGIVWLAVVAESAFTAITGTGVTGGHYTAGGRIGEAAFAVGIAILGFATLRTLRRTQRVLDAARAKTAGDVQRAKEENPPEIKYSAFDDKGKEIK